MPYPLTTQLKMAVVLIIDDSKSTGSISDDALLLKKLKIKNLIDRIYIQSSTSTLVDIWTYGRDTTNITSGFKTSKWEVLQYADLLYDKGTSSDLFEATTNAVYGLNYQSIIDAIYYPEQEHVNTDADLLLAQEYTPVIIVVSDGENSGSNSASDVVIAAQSSWGDNGVPVIVYGWGEHKKQSYLRTIADDTNGVFFDIKNLQSYARVDIASSILTSVNHGFDNNAIIAFAYSTYGILTTNTYYVDKINDDSFRIKKNIGGSPEILAASTGDVSYDYCCEIDDWEIAAKSTDHLNDNNIYKGNYIQNYDFTEATWVKDVTVNYTTVPNGQCIATMRYSKDRFTWSSWITIPNTTIPIDDLIYSLQFSIYVANGWSGTATIPQTIDSLTYTTVEPSIKYYVTDAKENLGMIYQYLLSAAIDLPKTTRINWAICRGDSTNLEDFESIYNGRNSVLSNRQSSIRYTTEIIRDDLPSVRIADMLNTFQVNEKNGTPATWNSDDVVILKMYGRVVDPSQLPYSTDHIKGWIILPVTYTLPFGSTFTVGIITPEKLTNVIGELAYTYDNRTYYATNGIWSPDASVIVLKNNLIIRGGYWISSQAGTITFDVTQESNDIISIYIQHSQYYRIGVEVINYDADNPNPVIFNHIGMYFTQLSNSDLLNQYSNSKNPTLSENPVVISNEGSVLSRMYIFYDFVGWQGAKESGTAIRWWKVGIITDTEITSYRNRTTSLLTDAYIGNGKFTIGDEIYVEIVPADGTIIPVWTGSVLDKNGLNTYYSDPITLNAGDVPVVWDLRVVYALISAKYTSVNVDPVDGSLITVDSDGNAISHGFSTDDKIGFIATTYPDGIAVDTAYYAIPDVTDTTVFRLASIPNNGTAISITGTSTGLQVFKYVETAPAGTPLTADYKFYDPDNTLVDNCTITWYVNDSTTPFYVGKTMTSNEKTIKGQSVFFTVLPQSKTIAGVAQTIQGIIVQSDSVVIV